MQKEIILGNDADKRPKQKEINIFTLQTISEVKGEESMTRHITKCPEGHEVVTSKKKGIQCKRCSLNGIGKRFDLKK